MSRLANAGEALAMHARLMPDKIGASDLDRRMTFRLWHQRACRLANALMGLGLGKGDRVAVLAYNAIEWLEIYAATALSGIVAVPVNFRLTAQEAHYIIENCEARALIVQDELVGTIEAIRGALGIADKNVVVFGKTSGPAGFADVHVSHCALAGTVIDVPLPFVRIAYVVPSTETVTGAIHERDGDVLKFIGDGVLAIFPVGEEGDFTSIAVHALDAGRTILARLDERNVMRRAAGLAQIRIGIGLHLGEVIYGNVGGFDRLDFTVIGPAVNLAARLEGLTKRLMRPLLTSQAFAAACPLPLASLGYHPVRGFSEPEEVFGLPG